MISIITPILNEESYVDLFFNSLKKLDGEFELIIVDGGSNDKTIEKIEKIRMNFNRRTFFLKSSRGRAIQMNTGANQAKGDVFLFLHIDCVLPSNALRLIEHEINKNNKVGGAFKQTFSERDPFLKIISIFGNLRSKITKIFYGDYGIFVKKEVFKNIGGYDNIPMFEDSELCRKIKKYGRLAQIDENIFTSCRRYLDKGKLRLTIIYILTFLFYLVKRQPSFLINYFEKI